MLLCTGVEPLRHARGGFHTSFCRCRRRYCGYESPSQLVKGEYAIGKFLAHVGSPGGVSCRQLSSLHLCVWWRPTRFRNSSFSFVFGGNSAFTTLSTSSAVVGRKFRSSTRRMCAWGSPRFCHSVTWICPTDRPRTCFLVRSFISASSLHLNTRVWMSVRVSWPPFMWRHASIISGHFGLHVIVMNNDGLPSFRTIAIAFR